MAEYTGTLRTTLTVAERKNLKRIASAKGMTLVGFYDSVLRNEIKKSEKPSKEVQP